MASFDDLMFEALDDTLRRVLGENISELIYPRTVKKTPLKPEEISNKIENIISYLEKLIGKESTQIIQSVSIKRLCFKLKQEYEEIENHFVVLDELYEMKFKLLAPLQNKEQSEHN